MKRVLAILSDTSQGFMSYLWKATLISVLPALAVSAVSVLVAPRAERPEFTGPLVVSVVGLLLISPWIETLAMWPILAILKKFTQKAVLLAVLSALTWAALHSLAQPVWGLIVVWSFFVLSASFLAWEQKSKTKAIAVTASIHMCQNLIPIALLVGIFLASGQRWDAFKRQIADSSNYVVHQEDNRFRLTFRQPLLEPYDLRAYFQTFARLDPWIDTQKHSCALRCSKVGTTSHDQDILYAWHFAGNRLEFIELKPNLAEISSTALLLSGLVPVRRNEKQRAFSSDFKAPALDDFFRLLGAPTSTTTNSDLTVVTWKYDLHPASGLLPAQHDFPSWQVRVDVQKSTNRVSEIHINLPLLNAITKLNYEDQTEPAN